MRWRVLVAAVPTMVGCASMPGKAFRDGLIHQSVGSSAGGQRIDPVVVTDPVPDFRRDTYPVFVAECRARLQAIFADAATR
jgi:hypothetical protein